MKKLIAVCLLLSVAGISNLALSQSAVDNTEAVATVDVFTPITIDHVQDLDFGEILSNETTNPSVDPTVSGEESQSAKWEVSGSSFAGTTVNLSFNLPEFLSNNGTDIPINFGSTSAVWNSTDNAGSGTTFDPDNPGTEATDIDFSSDNGADGNIFVWLGGTLDVSGFGGNIPEGNYTGDITFTADYGF